MEMKLSLRLEPIGKNPVEEFYRKNYKFEVEVNGEKIRYVFCSNPFLNKYGDGSNLGFVEDDMIFISKGLHYAQVPFVALYLYYKSLSSNELSQKIGEDTANITSSESQEALIKATLDQASDYLRREEISNLVERFRNEPYNNLPIRESMLKDFMGLDRSPKDSEDLIKYEGDKTKFYVERVNDFLKAHHNNKHIARSRAIEMSEELRDSFSELVIKSERPYQYLINDPVYKNNLIGVIEFINQLENLECGTRLTIGREESRLCYSLIEHLDKNLPIKFIETEEINTESNVIEIGKRAKPFFSSLRKRLEFNLLEEHRQMELALQDLESIVTKVDQPQKEFLCLVKDVIKDYFTPKESVDLVPKDVQIKVFKEELSSRKREVEHVLTKSSDEIVDLEKAVIARANLLRLGLSVEEVDRKINALIRDSPQNLLS